jgi:hypothetical protein
MKKFLLLVLLCIPSIALAQFNGGYDPYTTPIAASANGTTAATVATLGAVAGKTTFLCGLSIRATATAATQGFATVTGTINGTMSFLESVSVTNSTVASLDPHISPTCIPASAPNTPIVVTSIASGTGGLVSVNAWGYTR